MSNKFQKLALGYVRESLNDRHLGISKPVHLEHWLAVLGGVDLEDEWDTWLIFTKDKASIIAEHLIDDRVIRVVFNLQTGQPAQESDYKALCDIIDLE